VRVAARTSAFAFKGKPADVREIAQSLAVRHVLEGSVRREGDRLRVTAQLIDAQSGYHVWSHSYDRKWKDLLDIQDDISRSIVDALQLVLSSEIIERLDHAKTTSLEAFDLYLAGLAKLGETSTGTQLEEAERIFQASLAVDPKFARAYAGLCETYAAGYRRNKDPALAGKAEASCNKALALDASLREVEQALATLYVVSGRAERAVEIYKKFLARNPSDADAYIGLAQAYDRQGRKAEAEATYHRAIDAEPSYAKPHMMLGHFLFDVGRNDEAVAHLRRVTDLTPTSPRAWGNLGGALQIAGDLEGAARALERSLELEPTQVAYSNTGTLYFYLGRFQDAEKMYLKATEMAPRDHRTWANLADARFQMENRKPEAKQNYEHAITLALQELRLNANDPDTIARLAYYNARIGNFAQAHQFAAKAGAIPTESFYVYYFIALAEIEEGKLDAALDAVEKAVESGYPAQMARIGPEFAKLRDRPRFQRLIANSTRHTAGS
jgi:tetratricopeptide (TPR) repeat protein